VAQRQTRIPNASRGRKGDGTDEEPAEKRRGTGRTSRGRRTRQLLVDAARTVFERDGFLHARIADICDEAGISHGSFYTYFVSKEQIFGEVVDTVELDLLRLEPPAEEEPIERIRSANRQYLEHYRDNAGIMAVIQQVSTFDAEVQATRIQRHDEFAHAIERRTVEYQKAGIADPEVDPWLSAIALGGMVAFVADQMFVQHQDIGLDDAVDQLTLLWANAIGLGRPT
jgi:AcrR family transcriptional regulator